MSLELIEEKQYDKEIRDVEFGETEDGRLYPKIIIFEDEIRFYNKDFNLVNSLNYGRGGYIAVSQNGYYLGAEVIIKKPIIEKGNAQVTFAVYDENIKQKTNVQYKVGYDGEGAKICFISDKDGSFIQANPRSVELWFYDIDGNLKNYIDIFEGDSWDIAKSFKGSFTKDGEYFACVVEHRFPYKRHNDVYLILFNKEGKELWRNLLEDEKRAISFSISSKGNFIMANAHFLFDGNGNLIGKYDGQIFKFSENEKYLVIGERNKVQFIKPSTGEVLWLKESQWPVDSREEEWRWIENVGVTSDGIVSVVSSLNKRRKGGWDRWDTSIEFYNVEGDKLGEVVWDGKRKGKLKISENGEDFLIWYSNNLQHYKSRRE